MITKARDPEVWKKTRYFPIQKHWRKLGPIFRSDEARKIWHPCMEEFMVQRAEGFAKEGHHFTHKPQPDAKCPQDYESCDWRCDCGIPWSKQPKFWDYARHSACHWVADLALFVAKSCYPDIPWRILTAQKHTTVWNGSIDEPILFDINYFAMGVDPDEAMKLASKGRELKPGKYLKPYLYHS